MAATNTTVVLPPGTWTLLTGADITTARVQNLGGSNVRIMGTVGATPPTALPGSLELKPGEGFATDLTLAQMFPGVAVTRLYAICSINDGGLIGISHA